MSTQPATSVVDAFAATDGPDPAEQDHRLAAVLDLLGAADAGEVSQRYGIDPPLLERYRQAFLAAGQDALTTGSDRQAAVNRDRYLALIAHELKSPLTTIRAWVELLKNHPEPGPDLRARALDGVTAHLDRLSRLAQDTLDATSVALGRLPLRRSSVDLGDLVASLIAHRPRDGWEVCPATDVLPCRVDTDRVAQVLDNLLDNAARYGDGVQRVTVGRHGLFGQVTVASGGVPIPPDVARRLFEPFERGSDRLGTGLGLYVCRSLIAAHGGQIGLRVDNEGNQFWFRIPLVV